MDLFFNVMKNDSLIKSESIMFEDYDTSTGKPEESTKNYILWQKSEDQIYSHKDIQKKVTSMNRIVQM